MLMITWPALCPAGSTFWNKTPKSQLPFNRISSSFFCAASVGITESNRMQQRSFRRTNISKLNFASGRTGRTAGPVSSMLVKLSLILTGTDHACCIVSKMCQIVTNRNLDGCSSIRMFMSIYGKMIELLNTYNWVHRRDSIYASNK